MKIVGCDLHARQQTIAMVDTETGEFTEKNLSHEGTCTEQKLLIQSADGRVTTVVTRQGANKNLV